MPHVTVALPSHLRTLAGIEGQVTVDVPPQPTIADVLDALETSYPVLRGTIRDHGTHKRRAFMRYFACEQDVSHDPPDTLLPDPLVTGNDVFRVVTAIAGG
jgi:sulfur-carrier protein